MKYVFLVFWAIIIIAGITFATLNSHSVVIRYYFNQATLPLALLLAITVGVGFLLGAFAMLTLWWRAKQANRRMKQRIKAIEQELTNLRTIPIKETP